MNKLFARLGCWSVMATAWLSLSLGAQVFSAEEPNFSPEDIKLYETQVKPILDEHCLKCHGGEKTKADLRITSRGAFLRGGESGVAVNLDKPDGSLLLKMINYADDDHQMPPKQKLPADQIALITQWVKKGLPWTPGVIDEHAEVKKKPLINDETRNYWAYKKPLKSDLPKVANAKWVTNPIDAYILADLDAHALKPAPPATPEVLIRRVYYDLLGLPPTAAEVAQFAANKDPKAYEKLIDRLLASPHYGEKWGRHWLDVVGYAETNGYERDGDKPNVWRYRDYVVKAFNTDKPYDQFVKEQLAGDEMPNKNPDSITATGFYRLGVWDDEPADRELAKYDGLDAIVSTTSGAFLGMALGCARCHDHKRDPLPQDDYYRLLGFFHNLKPMTNGGDDIETTVTTSDEEKIAGEKRIAQLETEIAALEKALVAKSPPSDSLRAAQRELSKLKKNLPGTYRTISVSEHDRVSDTFVLSRGNPSLKTKKVEPGFPQVLGFAEPTLPKGSRGRRTLLADWILNPDNPLTARVMVNRLWQHHFGRGIVGTSNDFGKLGEAPTNQPLLDYLAIEFQSRSWSIKSMHRFIMASSTYRMSSKDDSAALAKDAGNLHQWRFNMRRLTAEEMRDSILAVDGNLNLTIGGPSIFAPIPQAVLATSSKPKEVWGKSSPEDEVRRSIYIKVKRSLIHPLLSMHDFADTDSSCPVRFATTVPTQALSMLNSEFINQRAEAFAKRLMTEEPTSVNKQVALGLRLVTQREPKTAEIRRALAFMQDLQANEKADPNKALALFCLMALNLNEFVFLD